MLLHNYQEYDINFQQHGILSPKGQAGILPLKNKLL